MAKICQQIIFAKTRKIFAETLARAKLPAYLVFKTPVQATKDNNDMLSVNKTTEPSRQIFKMRAGGIFNPRSTLGALVAEKVAAERGQAAQDAEAVDAASNVIPFPSNRRPATALVADAPTVDTGLMSWNNPRVLKACALAGHRPCSSVIRLTNARTHEHYTYRITRAKPVLSLTAPPSRLHYVDLLSRAAVGRIDDADGFSRTTWRTDATVVAAQDMWSTWWSAVCAGKLPADIVASNPDGRCCRCQRKLEDETSLAIGIGPDCHESVFGGRRSSSAAQDKSRAAKRTKAPAMPQPLSDEYDVPADLVASIDDMTVKALASKAADAEGHELALELKAEATATWLALKDRVLDYSFLDWRNARIHADHEIQCIQAAVAHISGHSKRAMADRESAARRIAHLQYASKLADYIVDRHPGRWNWTQSA